MVLVDLKDVYIQVPVHPLIHLCIRFDCVIRSVYSSSGVHQDHGPCFTELHKQGIWLLRYLDGWVLLGSFYQEALDSTQVLLRLCAQLGIRINFNKSCLHPAQELVFLGVNILTLHLKAFPKNADRLDS